MIHISLDKKLRMIAEKDKTEKVNEVPPEKDPTKKISHQIRLPPYTLSSPIDMTMANPKNLTFEQLLKESRFACLSNTSLAYRLDKEFYITSFNDEFQMQSTESLKFEDMIDSAFGHGEILILLPDRVLSLRLNAGLLSRNTLMVFEPTQQNKYRFLISPEHNVVFLITCTNCLDMYKIVDGQIKLCGSAEILLKDSPFKIFKAFGERREFADNYSFVLVSQTINNGVFDREWLHVLEVSACEQSLKCEAFEVLSVRQQGHLNITRFQLWVQEPDNHEYLEICMNNEILVICKFIKKYMIWQALYHKKIKQQAKTGNFGLCRHNYFYIVERLHIQIHRFWFIQDKKLHRNIIRMQLQHFIPDQMAEVRPMLGYAFTEKDGKPVYITLNCEITPSKIIIYLRKSIQVDIWIQLDRVVTLIDLHKEFQKELDKVINFIAAKSGYSTQEVLKQVWTKWPKIPQKNSNSIRKLLMVGEPHYIQKQMIALLKKERLKVDLIEDILAKCEVMYRKLLLKNFTSKLLRQYVKCNFKAKKIRLHMLTCKTKDISFAEYKELMKLNMDSQIKKYLPQFRKVDLQVALSQFSCYFLMYYSDILCYGFSRIKDIKYFVTNFNFLFPTVSKTEIWQLNLDRKDTQITIDKLMRIHSQAASKQGTFEQTYRMAQKQKKQYMINNDVFTEKTPINQFKDAYQTFFSAIVESTELSGQQTIQILQVLCSLNNVKQNVKVHLECVLELYFAIEGIESNKLSLKHMFNLTSKQLFEHLLELGIYDSFIKVVRPAFEQLSIHNLSESFEKYLNNYFCQHSVFNQHFPKILLVSEGLPQVEHQSILETMLDCIFYSMEIGQAEQIQNYIERYYLVELQSDMLRSKILRIENILAQEELFLKVDPKLKLIEIQIGQEVFKRKISRCLQQNKQSFQVKQLSKKSIHNFVQELIFLRNEFYQEVEFESIYSKLINETFNKLKIWKHFVQTLENDYFNELSSQVKKDILMKQIQSRRNKIYKSGDPVSKIKEQMSNIVNQSSDKQFMEVEKIILEWIQTFQAVGIIEKIPLAIDYNNQQTRRYFQKLIDSQQFLSHEPEHKKHFIKHMQQLMPNSNLNQKLIQIRIRDLTEMCQRMLQNNDYSGFLEGFSEYLGKCKEDFSMQLKILWVKFIGQFIQEKHWDEIGVYILKKCLYLIVDFKESMRQFFEFLNNDLGLDLLPSPQQSIRLRSSFHKRKGKEWIIRRIQVIDLKIKRSIIPKSVIEFVFRHILIVDYKLAFGYLRAHLAVADIQNIYKIVVLCMQSEYFISRLQIITCLIETICRYFTMQYSKETAGLPDTNENELLRLILKLKPNAKDQQSRNMLTFFQNIISNCVRLQHFYQKNEKPEEQPPHHELDISRINLETILMSLECFNQSMFIPKGSPNQVNSDEPMIIQIGQALVDSSEGSV